MSSKSVKVRVYERSLEDDTSYCDKMLHLTKVGCYIFRRKLVFEIFGRSGMKDGSTPATASGMNYNSLSLGCTSVGSLLIFSRYGHLSIFVAQSLKNC